MLPLLLRPTKTTQLEEYIPHSGKSFWDFKSLNTTFNGINFMFSAKFAIVIAAFFGSSFAGSGRRISMEDPQRKEEGNFPFCKERIDKCRNGHSSGIDSDCYALCQWKASELVG